MKENNEKCIQFLVNSLHRKDKYDVSDIAVRQGPDSTSSFRIQKWEWQDDGDIPDSKNASN
jgi:hypothetical protein